MAWGYARGLTALQAGPVRRRHVPHTTVLIASKRNNAERRVPYMQDFDLNLGGNANVAKDLLPTKKSKRDWGIYSYFATWIGMESASPPIIWPPVSLWAAWI